MSTIVTLKQKIANIKSEIGVMQKDTKGFNYKYFDINKLVEALRPLEEKYKLSITLPLTSVFGTTSHQPSIRLQITDLESDEEESYETVLPNNPDPQKMGGIITYWRRYMLVSYLNIQAEDDDASSASGANAYTKPKVVPTAPVQPPTAKVMTPFTSAEKKVKSASNIGELTKLETQIMESTVLTPEEKLKLEEIIGDIASMM